MLRTTALLTAALVVLTASPATAHPSGDWAGWQKDPNGSRHNAAEWRLDQNNAGKLKLKWAFAYPKGEFNAVRSQPAVVGDTIYFGGPDGKFYARDKRTGNAKWEFTLPPATRYAYNSDGPTVSNGKVFFGDSAGRLFALDQRTGQKRWQTQMDDTIASQTTSSPIVHDGHWCTSARPAARTCCRATTRAAPSGATSTPTTSTPARWSGVTTRCRNRSRSARGPTVPSGSSRPASACGARR